MLSYTNTWNSCVRIGYLYPIRKPSNAAECCRLVCLLGGAAHPCMQEGLPAHMIIVTPTPWLLLPSPPLLLLPAPPPPALLLLLPTSRWPPRNRLVTGWLSERKPAPGAVNPPLSMLPAAPWLAAEASASS